MVGAAEDADISLALLDDFVQAAHDDEADSLVRSSWEVLDEKKNLQYLPSR
jgi:hypothetical protein